MKNIGKSDQIIRIILGTALLVFFIFSKGNIRYVGLLGVILIGTASVKFCPTYKFLGISTRPND